MDLQGAVRLQPAMQEAMPANKLFIHDGKGFVELIDCFGSDLTVVNTARVSFHKESAFEQVEVEGKTVPKLAERDAKLIKYLADHRHSSPFFHPQISLRIKMPIFIAREWFKHSVGFTRNEVSRRYVTDAPGCFMPAGLRQRDKNLKQGSKQELVENSVPLMAQMQDYFDKAQEYYQYLLDQGVAPEQARMVLPQAMYTEFIETASLAGYARLVRLRVAPLAQREIQEYAHLVSDIVSTKFPVSWQALMNAPME
ncbi:FAD-dependent thymidylate synthase [Candidatus Dependentiae bacterium]|nr:FAD-dependent thymidylate synthase [Candidatus Dependentiae bacterium]